MASQQIGAAETTLTFTQLLPDNLYDPGNGFVVFDREDICWKRPVSDGPELRLFCLRPHTDGKQNDAFLPCCFRRFQNLILWLPISEDNGNSGDAGRAALRKAKNFVCGKLNGSPRVCVPTHEVNGLHRFYEVLVGPVLPQRNLQDGVIAVLDNSNLGEFLSNFETGCYVDEPSLDYLKVDIFNAPGAI